MLLDEDEIINRLRKLDRMLRQRRDQGGAAWPAEEEKWNNF
jgi:hypothetical protein